MTFADVQCTSGDVVLVAFTFIPSGVARSLSFLSFLTAHVAKAEEAEGGGEDEAAVAEEEEEEIVDEIAGLPDGDSRVHAVGRLLSKLMASSS